MTVMTLVEYAKGLPKENVNKAVIEVFASASDIFAALPFVGFSGSSYETYIETDIGHDAMAFRGINEGSTTGKGTVSPKQEASFVLDHDIDVDRAIVDRHGPERRNREEKLAIKRAGRLWANTFLNGDNSTQPREFDGVKRRVAKAGTSAEYTRIVHNSAASGGAALSLAKLDELLNQTSGVTHILMPRLMKTLWIAAARSATLTNQVVDTGFDEVGKPRLSYAGIPFLFGYEREPEGDLLSFDEVASGGGSAVTGSIYAMRFAEDGLHGIELKPLMYEDVGLLESRTAHRGHLSWDVGLADEHPYCLGRLDSITNAAIAA